MIAGSYNRSRIYIKLRWRLLVLFKIEHFEDFPHFLVFVKEEGKDYIHRF